FESFDYVFCSLFLHHFDDTQVAELLANFYRTARRGVIVSDLDRHIVPYLFFPATRPFFGWTRITLHDGMTSVRAGFKASELVALATRAGLANLEIEVHRPAFRISLIARK